MSDARAGDAVWSWWRSWVGDRQSGAARGFTARARRATDIELLCDYATHQLAQALSLRSGDADRLLRMVRVLTQMRESHAQPLARRLGGTDPVLSSARFKRLMRSDGKDLTAALVRAVAMLSPASKPCNINRLSEDLFFWNDQTRARWTFEYYGATPPETLKQADASENKE